MAEACDNPGWTVPKEMLESVDDLSLELQALGVKPIRRSDCGSSVELNEALLSSAWSLVNLVHGHAMGFKDNLHTSEKEALLSSEKQSLESKLQDMTKELKAKENIITSNKEDLRQLKRKFDISSEELAKQRNMSIQLMSRLQNQERDLKHEISKQATEMEHLRNMIRKSLGVGQRPQSVHVERLGDFITSLSVSDRLTEDTEVQQTTINRLKIVNNSLVGENLTLRDALKMLHLDLHNFLESICKIQDCASPPVSLPENLFQLPLTYSSDKLKEVRQQQLSKLREQYLHLSN